MLLWEYSSILEFEYFMYTKKNIVYSSQMSKHIMSDMTLRILVQASLRTFARKFSTR